MKKVKFGLLGLVILLILIQFIPVDMAKPSIDATLAIDAPPEVKQILENSCYDCHSYQTKWPIYSRIAPVSWLVASDVEEGRHKLNFSEWLSFSDQKKAKLKEEIIDEIEGNDMPLPIYLIMHSEAKLGDSQKQTIKNWATTNIEPEPESETD
ncbi:MAG: heme-binding domain-containing protein [Candidatus Zixiibacteriota bacterium]